MSWEPELEELRRREALAREMGGEERVARQHASGRRTVRERIDRLFDPGTFHETGALAGSGDVRRGRRARGLHAREHGLRPGRIDGRAAVVQGDDFTVRGGAADAAIWQKMVYAERLAHDLRLPLVRLVDGTGGGGSVKSLEQMGHTYVPFIPGMELAIANLARVPVVAARARAGGGLGAARVVASHFSVIVRGTAQLVRGRPAGGRRRDGRVARQGGARRLAHADARGRGRQRGGRRGRRARPAQALPLLPAAERVGAAAGDRRDRPARPPRGGALSDRPARPAPALRHARDPRRRLRPRQRLRARQARRPQPDLRWRGSTGTPSACSPPTRSTTAAG